MLLIKHVAGLAIKLGGTMNWPLWLVSLSIVLYSIHANDEIYFCGSGTSTTKWTFAQKSNCSTKPFSHDSELSSDYINVDLFVEKTGWVQVNATICILKSIIISASTTHAGQIDLRNSTSPIDKPLTNEECMQMVKNRTCRFGSMEKVGHKWQKVDNKTYEPRGWFLSAISGPIDYLSQECLAFTTNTMKYKVDTGELYVPALNVSTCNITSKTGCQVSDRILIKYKPIDIENMDDKFEEVASNVPAYYAGKRTIYLPKIQMALDISIAHDKILQGYRFTTLQGYLILCSDPKSGFSTNCTRAGDSDWKNKGDKDFEVGSQKTAQEAGRHRYLQQQYENQFRIHHNTLCDLINSTHKLQQQVAAAHPTNYLASLFGTRALVVNYHDGIFEIRFCTELNTDSITFVPDDHCTGQIRAKFTDFGNHSGYIDQHSGRVFLNLKANQVSQTDCDKSILFRFNGKFVQYWPKTGDVTVVDPLLLPNNNPKLSPPKFYHIRNLKQLGKETEDSVMLLKDQYQMTQDLKIIHLPENHPNERIQPTGTIWSLMWDHPIWTSVITLSICGTIMVSILCCCGKIPSFFVAFLLIRDAYKCVQNFRQNQPPPIPQP